MQSASLHRPFVSPSSASLPIAWFLALSSLGALAPPAAAGTPTGGIRGRVGFSSFNILPFPVAAIEIFQGLARVDSTGINRYGGAFEVTGLSPGSYRLTASAFCFETVELPAVEVSDTVTNVGRIILPVGASRFRRM